MSRRLFVLISSAAAAGSAALPSVIASVKFLG